MGKHLWAALIFFTRLPFWRIASVPAECFKHVVPYWPVAGWITGGVLAGSLWLLAQVLPVSLAWILALAVRLRVTGCLHEDGWADFCDGFGGGTTRERTLAIMKDSHIGTYGVIGLIFYFLVMAQMAALPLETLCGVAWAADVWAKGCASHLINLLPYARKEEESKAQVVYARMSLAEVGVGVLAVAWPLVWLVQAGFGWTCLVPVGVLFLLYRWMKRRLGGYTGDCCGALFLLGELSLYIAILAWNGKSFSFGILP